MKKIWLLIVFCLLTINCYAKTIVFEGIPTIRNSSSFEGTINERIRGKEQIKYKLIITKKGNDYIWFSREKKKLKYSKSGIFHYFVQLDGSGYIKITKTDEGSYTYLEHMNFGFQTITYWGVGNKLEL